MVLCEIMNQSELGFLETWILLTIAAWISLFFTSGIPFAYYYMFPTYEKWLKKTNSKYPSPEMVRSEMFKSAKGVISVTLCPTLALYLAKIGKYSQAYCGVENVYKEIAQFILVFFFVDFFEWGWHYMGHRFDTLWAIHRPHHKYHNPTPWAVIADDAPDEIARGSPLFLLPMLMPINLELLFLQFILFFNFYGTAIHTGIDWDILPIHNQTWLNTPYHHHIWDQFMGSVYKGEKCYCAACDVKAGNRTPQAWEAVKKEIPDYSVLFTPSFWWNWTEEEKESVKAE